MDKSQMFLAKINHIGPAWRIVAVLFVLALSLSGCFACGSDAMSLTPPTSCEFDDECPEGTCVLGVCASPDALSAFHLEVVPDQRLGLPAQQFLDLSTLNDETLLLGLRTTVTVSGRVRDSDDAAIRGRISLRNANVIPGRVLVSGAELSEDGEFSIPLFEGDEYEMRCRPENLARPVWTNPNIVAGIAPIDIVLPALDNYERFSGRIVAGVGVARVPIPGMSISMAQNGSVVSSLSTTDENGDFELLVDAERLSTGEPFLLQIDVTPENTQYPAVTVELGENPARERGEISLGEVLTPVQVSGTVVDTSGVGVAGVAVTLQGTVGNGVLTQVVPTDASGRFTANTPPGLYDVTAVSAAADKLHGRATVSGVDIGGAGITVDGSITSELQIIVPARLIFRGTMIDSDGTPVTQATIDAIRIGSDVIVDQYTAASPTFSSGASGSDGVFELAVDPGRYRLSIRVPNHQRTDTFEYSLVRTLDESVDALALEIPRGLDLVGQLLDAGGRALGSAEVRIYSTLVDDNGQAISLGRGRTTEDGVFAIMVPELTE